MSIFRELKRRNVIKIAIAYAVVAWLLIEVTSTIFPIIRLPDWSVTLVTALLLIGFPVALIFAWAFEITPEGIKREKEVDRSQSSTHITGRNIDYIIIAALVLALGFFAFDKFVLDPSRDAELVQATTQAVTEQVTESVISEIPDKSIAVLPFANRSSEQENAQFFADGVHDDLLTLLANLDSLKVISRTSVMGYRDTTKNMKTIGEELGVATILEGGVQRAGNQIRINVQLIDASTDEHIWAKTYDRDLTAANIFAIQTDIATSIADQLQATMSQDEQTRISAIPTESLPAYEAYLLGNQRLARQTSDSLAEALGYFQKAIELDPEFASTYVGLADTYTYQMNLNLVTYADVGDLRNAALDKALELDDQLGELHASLAGITSARGDKESAEAQYKLAITLSPNNAEIYTRYGLFLSNQGRVNEGLAMSKRGAMLDPLSTMVNFNIGHDLMNLGRFEEGEAQYKKVIEIDPRFANGYRFVGSANWFGLGRLDEAIRWYRKSIEIDPGNPIGYAWLAAVYMDLGDDKEVEIFVRKSFEIAPKSFWPNLLMAVLHMNRGEDERAQEYSRKAAALSPRFWENLSLLRDWDLKAGLYADARDRYKAVYSELFYEEDPVVNNRNFRIAIDLALVLMKTGETDLADKLLDRAWEVIQDRPRLGFYNGFWLADAEIYSIRGQNQEALAALREAFDEGWRFFWRRYLGDNLNFEPLHGEPEFEAIKEEARADMAIQLARVNAMKTNGEIPTSPE